MATKTQKIGIKASDRMREYNAVLKGLKKSDRNDLIADIAAFTVEEHIKAGLWE